MERRLVHGDEALPTRTLPLDLSSLVFLEEFYQQQQTDNLEPVVLIKHKGNLLTWHGNHRLTLTIKHGNKVWGDILRSGEPYITPKGERVGVNNNVLWQVLYYRLLAEKMGYSTFRDLYEKTFKANI